jgi:protein involved in polysaccharide export with SLBB domain
MKYTRSYPVTKRLKIATLSGLALVCLGSLPLHTYAQDKPTPIRPDYKINIGDELTIIVLEESKISGQQVVTSDGKISFTYLGAIKVEGRTVESVRTEIATQLKKKKLFRNPTVSVSVRPANKAQINVVGTGIKSAGRLPLVSDWRVLDAITAAGGLGSSRYDLYEITLIKPRKNLTYRIDPAKLYADKPDQSINYLLDEDDTLKVDLKEESLTQVTVSGAVRNPSPVLLPRDGSIITVLNAVGGPIPREQTREARLTKAFIRRKGKEITIDLSGYAQPGWKTPEVLQPGDELIIPENKDFYTIAGESVASNRILYPDGRTLTLAKAIKESGVPLGAIELKKIVLTRTEKGETEKFTIDMDKVIKKGIDDDDMILKPDDSIYLPGHVQKRSFFDNLQGVSAALGVFFFLRNLKL